jgi:hypothetical protein
VLAGGGKPKSNRMAIVLSGMRCDWIVVSGFVPGIRVLEHEADHKRDIGESMRRSFERRCGRVEMLSRHLDHDDFGSNRFEIMDVIGSNI